MRAECEKANTCHVVGKVEAKDHTLAFINPVRGSSELPKVRGSRVARVPSNPCILLSLPTDNPRAAKLHPASPLPDAIVLGPPLDTQLPLSPLPSSHPVPLPAPESSGTERERFRTGIQTQAVAVAREIVLVHASVGRGGRGRRRGGFRGVGRREEEGIPGSVGGDLIRRSEERRWGEREGREWGRGGRG